MWLSGYDVKKSVIYFLTIKRVGNRWCSHFLPLNTPAKDNLESSHWNGSPSLSVTRFECLWITWEGRDRIGILLVYHPPCCPTFSLLASTGLLSDTALKASPPIGSEGLLCAHWGPRGKCNSRLHGCYDNHGPVTENLNPNPWGWTHIKPCLDKGMVIWLWRRLR